MVNLLGVSPLDADSRGDRRGVSKLISNFCGVVGPLSVGNVVDRLEDGNDTCSFSVSLHASLEKLFGFDARRICETANSSSSPRNALISANFCGWIADLLAFEVEG